MELDTGVAISVIREQTYKTVLLQQPPLQPSNLILHTYTGEQLSPRTDTYFSYCL